MQPAFQPHGMACRFPDPASASKHHQQPCPSSRSRADDASSAKPSPLALGRNDCASAQLCSCLCFFFFIDFSFLSPLLVGTPLQGKDSGSFIADSPGPLPFWCTCWMDGWVDGAEGLFPEILGSQGADTGHRCEGNYSAFSSSV